MRPFVDDQDVARWLRAETDGQAEAADRLFADLAARRWARIEVPAALAARITAAIGAGQRAWWDLWWMRAALLASMGAVGAVVALAPSSSLASAGVSGLVVWSQVLGWALACSERALDVAWTLWSAGARVSSWVGIVLSAPVAQLALALNLAMAAAGFVALRRLLQAEEMPS